MIRPAKSTCAEAAARLYEFLDRELTSDVERAVAAHLEECRGCVGHFEFERAFLAFVTRRAGGTAASEALRARVLQSIRAEPSPESG